MAFTGSVQIACKYMARANPFTAPFETSAHRNPPAHAEGARYTALHFEPGAFFAVVLQRGGQVYEIYPNGHYFNCGD